MAEAVARNAQGRVAIPLEPPAPTPSLIPADVWKSYQEELAEQESQASKRLVAEVAAEPVALPEVELDQELDVVSAQHLVGLLATTPADPELALAALREVKLFADLSPASLQALVQDARQGMVPAGTYLFLEGDKADAFYLVLEGAIEILRRRDDREVALRHMGRGDPIGLFGLFWGQLRAACARAIGDAVVLEIPCEALRRWVKKDTELNDRLFKFYEERLVEGFLGSTLLFSDVDSIGRARVLGRFKERQFRKRQALLRPGEVCNLLAVLISGRLLLDHRPRAGEDSKLYQLYPGQFVAVTSALLGSPSRMTITAAEDSTVMMIGHRELVELLRDYPALRTITHRLPAVATGLDRDVFCGHTGIPGV